MLRPNLGVSSVSPLCRKANLAGSLCEGYLKIGGLGSSMSNCVSRRIEGRLIREEDHLIENRRFEQIRTAADLKAKGMTRKEEIRGRGQTEVKRFRATGL